MQDVSADRQGHDAMFQTLVDTLSQWLSPGRLEARPRALARERFAMEAIAHVWLGELQHVCWPEEPW